MSKISIKTDFADGDKLFSSDLNNNFRVIQEGINANEANLQSVIDKAIIDLDAELEAITANRGWDWNTGERVIYFRGTAAELAQREIINGQLLVNSDTGAFYVDTGGRRISIEDAPLADLITRMGVAESDIDSIEASMTNGFFEKLTDGSNIDNLYSYGMHIYGVTNATGTLPSGYDSTNSFFIETYMWELSNFGRQLLYDVSSNKSFMRIRNNDTWGSWQRIDYNITSGTSDPSGGNDGDIYLKYS